jgi:hypothetical protein
MQNDDKNQFFDDESVTIREYELERGNLNLNLD